MKFMYLKIYMYKCIDIYVYEYITKRRNNLKRIEQNKIQITDIIHIFLIDFVHYLFYYLPSNYLFSKTPLNCTKVNESSPRDAKDANWLIPPEIGAGL